jgi:acetyl-CoA C-acetyltransferase
MQRRIPVIVGIGEITDRPDDLTLSLEPLELMARALRLADEDCGGHALRALDSLDVVHQVSWRYERTAASLCQRLDISPARAVYGFTGGESPMRYLHEAALRIERGESEIAAICGAEAQYAVNKASAAGVQLPWTPRAANVENPLPLDGLLNPIAVRHETIRPVNIYPFYENAASASWQQTPAAALAESGALWSRYADVAAANPYAWLRRSLTPEEITTPGPDNRPIAFPYTKHMVANPAVNQGAAIILTTLERARAWKIPDTQMVFVLGGAAAHEPRDFLQRDQYVRSDAQDRVLEATRRLSEDAPETLELYSCFPCVPKMARRVLRLPESVTPTVTGGLSFFGAPLNNYMTHAACAMVRALRNGSRTGLLYGQGEFVTKHHAVFVAREPGRDALNPQYSVQDAVDRVRGSVPPMLTNCTGRAVVESHTVIYDRDGSPRAGVVIARTPQARVMARVHGTDVDGIRVLTDQARSPVGLSGEVMPGGDDMLEWKFG